MKKDAISKHKFRVLKRRLAKPAYVVVGVLELLWLTTQISAAEGDIGRLSNEEIAAALEWEGDADQLIDTLVDCCWLDRDEEYRLIVHGWSEHVPTYLSNAFKKHGKKFADQVSVDRAKHHAKHHAKHDALEGAKHDAKHPAPNLTKPNQTKQEAADADFPSSLQTPRFAAAWADWECHRREIKKELKPTQTKKQLLWLASLGHDLAVRTIEHTIEKGWQGLRVPEGVAVATKPRFPSDDELANWNPTTGID